MSAAGIEKAIAETTREIRRLEEHLRWLLGKWQAEPKASMTEFYRELDGQREG